MGVAGGEMKVVRKIGLCALLILCCSVQRGRADVIPEHAVGTGQFWRCDNGYRKTGDTCVAIQVPPDARAIGDRWYCNDGFRAVGESCVAITVPPHARAIGSNWVCDSGYRRNGESCTEMSRAELIEFNEYLGRELVKARGVCEWVCEKFSDRREECKKPCRGEWDGIEK